MVSHYLKICTRSGLAAAAVALMLTFLPTDGTAQQQTRRVILTDLPIAEQMEIATLAEATGDEADKVLTQARTAHVTTDYQKAGELFERSAQMRTPGDRRGMEGFEAAGSAYFNAEEPARASRAWEAAGNLALIRGDVYAASENYMRAALAAHEDGNEFRVSDMGWKAYYLTESSRLSTDQKEQLGRYIAVRPVGLEEAQIEHRSILPYMQLISMRMVLSAEVERLQAVETHYRALRDSLAKSASRNPYASERITVTGYASQRGARAYNEALGLRRAEAARAYLVSNGVAESRIDIATRGEDNLSVAGPSEAADAANRRGVFTILVAERRISQN